MSFGDWLDDFESLTASFEDVLETIWRNDLEVAMAQEKKLRAIIMDLASEVDYIGVGAERRVKRSAKTRAATKRAQRKVERWKRDTIAALRAVDPVGFLGTTRKLAELRRTYQMAAQVTRQLFDRFADTSRFTAEQIAESKTFSRELARIRAVYGDDMRDLFGDLIDEAEFGKAENMAAGVAAGVREPMNFLTRWTAGVPGARIGTVRNQHRATEADRDDLINFLADWQLNRNQLRLSSVAHARGLFNTVVIRAAQAVGVSHFMLWVPKAEQLNNSGLQVQHLYEVRLGAPDGSRVSPDAFSRLVATALGRDPADVDRESRSRAAKGGDASARRRREFLARMLREAETIDTWPEVYRRISAGRQSTVPWAAGLTLRHNTREYYVPVPPSLLSEAREWSALQRSRIRKAA